MGNYFYKEIICNECKSKNIEPKYFTEKYLTYDEELVLFERIDKFYNSNTLSELNTEKNIIQYTCSNNHVFYNIK